jgi:hypothetical protein
VLVLRELLIDVSATVLLAARLVAAMKTMMTTAMIMTFIEVQICD